MSNPFIGELMGTMVLIIFGGGVVSNCLLGKTKGEGAGWITIITGWMVGVLMGVYVAIACGSPQGDINPVVTYAKTFMGIYTWSDAFVIMICQVIGGFLGGVIVWLAYLRHWAETEDKGFKLGVFCTGPAIRDYSANVLTEVIATTVLVFGVFSIFSQKVGGVAPGMGPYLVGILVWGLGASLGGPTGYAMNPARDLGPRLAHAVLPIAGKGDSDWGYSWVPIVGPFIGATIAYGLARFFGVI